MLEKKSVEIKKNLVKALNKIDIEPGDYIFAVCNGFIGKLTDYFFTIIDEGTASLGNVTLFTVLKENYTLINNFWSMYIDFDKYPPYSDAISEFLKLLVMFIFSVIMATLILPSNTTC